MADNPPKTTKKTAADHDDNILSDSDSTPDMECETCGISFTNAKSLQSHMQGKKHQKKVAEAKLMAKNLAATKNDESDNDDSEDSNDIHCEVCDKDFTGYMSFASHMKGSVHAKNVKKQKLKQQLENMPEVLDKEKGESGSDDDMLQKPYARCSKCQKEFSGPENFKLHMKSATHLKKVKETEALKKLKTDEARNSDDEEFYSKCDVCHKSFNGVRSYHIHMQSRVHKRTLEKIKVAEEIKEFCANDNFDAGYVCKECKKTFSDPLAFKSHLQNNSHEKQKAKDALVEFLHAYPEIVFVAPFDEEDSGDESDESKSDFYLICKLCHVSFSGPESAQDHVKSKKHINIKKEKKMLKLLKEQKKGTSSKSEKKNSTNTNNESSEKEISANIKQEDKKNGDTSHDFELI